MLVVSLLLCSMSPQKHMRCPFKSQDMSLKTTHEQSSFVTRLPLILVQLSRAVQDDGKFFCRKRKAMALEIRCSISWCELMHITRHQMLSNKWSEALKFNSHARGNNCWPAARACRALRAWSRKDCSIWRKKPWKFRDSVNEKKGIIFF